MDTPICDFVRNYAAGDDLRLHMPGHKGRGLLGVEALDITEIDGADSLYEADGIIRKSEENASTVFGCPTFYSTEGSSHCIRAMLYLCVLYGHSVGKRPVIAAGRNVHKTFLSAAALLEPDVVWLSAEGQDSYLSFGISPENLEKQLSKMAEAPLAVYITSPDYLGNVTDIEGLAAVCHRHGCLLVVDNAHGAYLRFLPQSRHPMDLGADLCCDSAHKTLPVITGGAYLHISRSAPELFQSRAKDALALFGSTSPSYLILQSLDGINPYLSEEYPGILAGFLPKIENLKKNLAHRGYRFIGGEPLKLTLAAKAYGYEGTALSRILKEKGVVCEFADPDYLVLMLTPHTDLERLADVLLSIPKQPPLTEQPPRCHQPQRVLSIREAAFSPTERIPVEKSVGRILAAAAVGCPPAVPILVCGERIDDAALRCFDYYGIQTCTVVKE